MFDSRFRVKRIEINDVKIIDPAQIQSALDISGESIFVARPSELAETVPTRCPGVQSAEVRLVLPDQVDVHVAERSVQFVWETDGKRYLLDESGMVLMPGEIIGKHVLIRDLDNASLQLGERVESATLSMVRALQACMPEVEMYDCSRDSGVSLTNELGWEIWFGVEGDAAYKVGLMRKLVDKLSRERRQVDYIDLRVEKRPVYQ